MQVKQLPSVDSLRCKLCKELILKCRTTVCGHSFCHRCIAERLYLKKQCPTCQKDFKKNFQLCSVKLLDHAVWLALDSPEAKCHFSKRLSDYNLWRDIRTVFQSSPGQQLDVLDSELIWCKATVELKIQTSELAAPLLWIHFEGWSRKYDEFIPQSSERVAPLGLFTSRNDLPRYKMPALGPSGQREDIEYAHLIHPDQGRTEQLRQLQVAVD